MKPKKFLNLVLAMMGTLFLTLFFSAVNRVEAGTTSDAGHEVFIYRGAPDDANDNWGNALELTQSGDDVTISNVHINSDFHSVVSFKITGVSNASDVENNAIGYEDISENGSVISFYEGNGTDNFIVFSVDVSDWTYSTFDNNYIDVIELANNFTEDCTIADGAEIFKISLVNEKFGGLPIVEGSIKYDVTKSYYKASSLMAVPTVLTEIEVNGKNADGEDTKEYVGELKNEISDEDGLSVYAVGSSVTFDISISSGTSNVTTDGKVSKWSYAFCSKESDKVYNCGAWTYASTGENVGITKDVRTTYYFAIRVATNLGTIKIYIYEVTLKDTPKLNLKNGVKLQGNTGGFKFYDVQLDASGNLIFPWVNESVTLKFNAMDIYYYGENKSLGIKEIYIRDENDIEKKLCGYNELLPASPTSCNNTGTEIDSGVGFGEVKTDTRNLGEFNKVIVYHVDLYLGAAKGDGGVLYTYSVTIRQDMKAPITPYVNHAKSPIEHDGKKYYVSGTMNLTISTIDDESSGVGNYSGIRYTSFDVYTIDGENENLYGHQQMVSNGQEIGLSLSNGHFKFKLISTDNAGNVSEYVYEFYVDNVNPTFVSGTSVFLDESVESFEDPDNASVKYYKTVDFYVSESDIVVGSSGIGNVEYCTILLEKSSDSPSTDECVWLGTTYVAPRYYGSTSSGTFSGYYRIAYRVKNNLGITTYSDSYLFNREGSKGTAIKALFIDNLADTITPEQELDSLWSNTEIEVSYDIVNSFSPLQSYVVKNTSNGEPLVDTILEDNKITFKVNENGSYVIEYFDLTGNNVEIPVVINGIDRENPVISAVVKDTPTNDVYLNDSIFITSNGNIKVMVYDRGSGVSLIKANVYVGDTNTKIFPNDKKVSCPNGTCTELVISLGDSDCNIGGNGVYQFEFEITDRAGNVVSFRTSSEANQVVEETESGTYKINGIETNIIYDENEVVATIGENKTWVINGTDTGIGAIYQFNYLSETPVYKVHYSYTDVPVSETNQFIGETLYSNNKLYLYIVLDASVVAPTEFKYSACVQATSNCQTFSPIDMTSGKIVIDDVNKYANTGKSNFVKIRGNYEGATDKVKEVTVQFMIDTEKDNLTISYAADMYANRAAGSATISVASDRKGGTNKKIIKYKYSFQERVDVMTLDSFASDPIVGSSNSIKINKNGNYYFCYVDEAGNVTIDSIAISFIDNLAPTISLVDSTGWKTITTSAAPSISINDNAYSDNTTHSTSSGVNLFAYTWTNNKDEIIILENLIKVNSTTGDYSTVNLSRMSSNSNKYISDGVYYLYVYVSDNVGNIFTGILEEAYVTIDTTNPKNTDITASFQYLNGNVWEDANGDSFWFRSDLNIKLRATELAASGNVVEIINGTYGKVVYAIATDNESELNYDYLTNPQKFSIYELKNDKGIELNKEGLYKIYIYSIDAAGNISNQFILRANIDKTAPIIKAGYTSVVSSNFTRSVELISNLSANISSYSYETIIKDKDIINYDDNLGGYRVSISRGGIYLKDTTSPTGYRVYISPKTPSSYVTEQERIKYTEDNFLICAEEELTYYVKLILSDIAGNSYVEYVDVYALTSVPPTIIIDKKTLGCESTDPTVVLCHTNKVTGKAEIKLIYGDEDVDGNRLITADSRLNPKEIIVNIGISSFTTFIDATVMDNNDKDYKITSTAYNIDLLKEGSSTYICFTAMDSSGNIVGNLKACEYDTDSAFKAYLMNDLISKGVKIDDINDVEKTEEYKTADAYRIKLTVGYLNGPYLSFKPFDPTNASFNSSSEEHIDNFEVTYLQRGIEKANGEKIEVPSYVESGVYFADYDNKVTQYTSFSTIGSTNCKIGVEIKKYIYSGPGEFINNVEFLLMNWKNPSYFVPVEYTGGEINLETPYEDAIYVIRYVDNQHVDDESTTRNIFRKVVYTTGVPIIQVTGLTTGEFINEIPVEKNSSDVIELNRVVSCFVYLDDGTKDTSKCILSWSIYDGDYKLLGDSSYKIKKNILGNYTIILNATDLDGIIVAPKTQIVINVRDNEIPTVTITGDFMTTEFGEPFTDLHKGVVVTDNYDNGFLQYKESHSLNVNELGCYTIIYTAFDSTGNRGSGQRIVCVVDTKKPEINLDTKYVEETTVVDGNPVNVKRFDLERTSTKTFVLSNYIKSLITSVSDNREELTIDDIVIEIVGELRVNVCGKYIVKVTINDKASKSTSYVDYQFADNVTTEYIMINVIDTKAPDVNVIYNTGREEYVYNNEIVTKPNSVLRVNLFDGEDEEFGDTITIKLNGNQISKNELNNNITSNGYYNFEFIDSSGNVKTYSFIVMMATAPTIRINSTLVSFDIINTSLVDVKNGSTLIKVRQESVENGITYEVGETIAVLAYSTVSSTERYDVLYSLVLTEELVSLLKIDDYEFELRGLNVNNAVVTKVNAVNSQKIGLTNSELKPTTTEKKENKNSAVGVLALGGLGLVTIGALLFLMKKKKKK